ncbi:hypothetical protein CEXT_418391 [Caerostris extrusa]|uniref:Uncharacterized protein n=1 Tax=Caerostris extrusa TaxID=172846 RepID=A0AAV4WUL9_CAEEX|nr:hypothetical protein CEXT_418391 [Caerostris extrusa]
MYATQGIYAYANHGPFEFKFEQNILYSQVGKSSNPSDNRNYRSCHNTFRCGWIFPRPLLNPFQMSVVNSLISLFSFTPSVLQDRRSLAFQPLSYHVVHFRLSG